MYKNNIVIFIICMTMYILNIQFRINIKNKILSFIAYSYFNDFVGSIAFCSYIVFCSNWCKFKFDSLLKVEITLLIAGIIWEYFIPIIRPDTVTDICDILVYCLGGILYWNIYSILANAKK